MSIQVDLPVSKEDKDKAIKLAIKEIEKEYGEGSVFDMSDKKGLAVSVIPSGIFGVDHSALTVGGLPRGRIVEIFGPESGGKTTMALQIIGQAQKAGGRAAFIDAEHALDPKWAAIQGVNVDDLLVSQPDWGEQAVDICIALVSSGGFDVVVVDSVAALVPKAELEGDSGDSHMGLQARLMSQAMRKLNGVVARTGTVLIFINQIREKIGVMFGSPETTTGGRALRFYASVRLDIRRVGTIKENEIAIGNNVKIKVAKNKVAAPFKEVEVKLLFDSGFDSLGSLIDPAIKYGIIEKSGAWYTYNGQRAQGEKKLKELVNLDTLTKQVLAAKDK